ncbi:MAG: hypothetical protein ACXWL5_02830 [Candidatus Chromulinivorax sp.]
MNLKFIHAFSWNTASTFIYKISLLSHQIALYSVVSPTLYGIQSSLFAIIYVTIALTNFGFNESLLAFFTKFTKNKAQFHSIKKQLILHACMLLITTTILYNLFSYNISGFLHNLTSYCNKNIIFMVCFIYYIEALKKALIAIMHLHFANKQIAFGQLAMLTTYLTCLWATFYITRQIDLFSIFFWMLITCSLELIYFCYLVYNFYQSLPDQNQNHAKTNNLSLIILVKERFYNYINQLTDTIYSPNCITLLLAAFLGFPKVATIKLFTNAITLLYTCISTTMHTTSGAFFASINNKSLKIIRKAFKSITHTYLYLIAAFTILLIISLISYWYIQAITTHIAFYIILFFIITMLEQINITYKQLCIAKGKTYKIAQFNMLEITSIIFSFALLQSNPFLFIFSLIIIKILFIISLAIFLKKQWNISL